MANTAIKIPRAHLIMALCLPLAVLVGYFLAEPLDSGSMAVVVLVMFVLAVPLLMKWHHPLLVLSWNASVAFGFMPGQPFAWMLMAVASLFFAVLNRSVDPEARFTEIPSLTKPIIFLSAVVAITCLVTGGIGLRSLGSVRYGGRNYVYVATAIAGYFALSSRRIPVEKSGLYVAMFFLPGMLSLIPTLAYKLGPSFYFLISFFQAGGVVEQAMEENSIMDSGIVRVNGLGAAGPALYTFVLARYGIRGALDFSKPWRLLLLGIGVLACAASGFRSSLILCGLIFCAVFLYEGLHRTRLLVLFAAIGFVIVATLLPNADKLPMVVQRTISFLPVKVNPIAERSASDSTIWRLQVWKSALPQIPKYLIKGKGFNMDPNELYLMEMSAQRHVVNPYEAPLVTGDYHSGPLSVIIPLGLFGVVGFVWFLTAGVRYLYHNYRFGNPQLYRINSFLLAFFVAKIVFFVVVFGSLYSDLYTFTGLLGLGVSLNGPPNLVPAAEATEPEQSALEAFS
jgi:hypothetical protein